MTGTTKVRFDEKKECGCGTREQLPEVPRAEGKWRQGRNRKSGHFAVIYEAATKFPAVVHTALRRGMPDGGDCEAPRVSSHTEA